MEDDSSTFGEELQFNRRDLLRGAVAAGVIGTVGIPAFSGNVAAATDETLYLLDTDVTTTELYSVTIDDTTNEAETTHLTKLTPTTNYKATAALAATPDGTTLYVIDRDSDHLGRYDVEAKTFVDLGQLGDAPGSTVQLTFAPDGTLYAGSNDTNKLYTVDIDAKKFEEVSSGASGVDMNGADLAFDNLGNLYLYTNAGGGDLYQIDPETGVASKIGDSGDSMTGLAVLDAGAGALLGSKTNSSQFVAIDKTSGSIGTAYTLTGDLTTHEYGDLTVGRLCQTTVTLCAAQDTEVGTVTVADAGGTVQITIKMDPDAGWLLYESHVDIGDQYEDFHTNAGGNPQVGQFDLSMEHDGVTEYTYTVDCDSPALSDVSDLSELFIAVHAVVKPIDGCADFSAFEAGNSVEGLGTVNPVLDITSTSSVSGAEAVAQQEGVEPATYGAPNGSSSELNGCLDDYGAGAFGGFSDIATKDAKKPHAYEFTVADGVSLTDFSLLMLDFGDYNPSKNTHHYAKMTAYDENGDVVDEMELEYWSDGKVNPENSYSDAGKTTTKWSRSLYLAGDACDADTSAGEPGNWVWSVAGEGIVTVELAFGDGHDPNIAFTDLCFAAEDETAWVCEYDEDVDVFEFEGNNWARYFTYELCDPDACS